MFGGTKLTVPLRVNLGKNIPSPATVSRTVFFSKFNAPSFAGELAAVAAELPLELVAWSSESETTCRVETNPVDRNEED